MTIRLILAGCGNMGYAMLKGWLNSGKLAAAETFVVEPNAELRARAAELGSRVASEVGGIPADAEPEIVVLAVKPQVIKDSSPRSSRTSHQATAASATAARPSSASQQAHLSALSPKSSGRRRRLPAACPTHPLRSARA